MKQKIVLGTRGSALALAQTEIVKAMLLAAHSDLEVTHEVIRTTGDIRLDVKLNEPGTLDKGLFTKELEEALIAKRIDAAVHSLKDLPTTLPDGLFLSSVLPRAETADILIGKSPLGLNGIAQGGIVATSSERRKRHINWLRPDIEVIAIRGNVPTRLQKLVDNEAWGGIILAQAGLERLGYDVESGHIEAECITFFATSIDEMLAAPGQGAIGLETREDDTQTQAILAAINHEPTLARVRAERALLKKLGGGCHMPLGVRTILDGDKLFMEAVLFEGDRREPHVASASGTTAEPEKLAETIYAKFRQ
ncbi:MAG: hydroxymethylbilane synthase [Chthoniobacterales bacterium]